MDSVLGWFCCIIDKCGSCHGAAVLHSSIVSIFHKPPGPPPHSLQPAMMTYRQHLAHHSHTHLSCTLHAQWDTQLHAAAATSVTHATCCCRHLIPQPRMLMRDGPPLHTVLHPPGLWTTAHRTPPPWPMGGGLWGVAAVLTVRAIGGGQQSVP